MHYLLGLTGEIIGVGSGSFYRYLKVLPKVIEWTEVLKLSIRDKRVICILKS